MPLKKRKEEGDLLLIHRQTRSDYLESLRKIQDLNSYKILNSAFWLEDLTKTL
jgi:hypothetical protein